jgi:predicted site-specific integrase-resolvase
VGDKRFYTIEEFVERLKQAGLVFSPRTVRHWITTGRIKAFRPGQRQWYIPVEEADRLMQGPPSWGRAPDDAWLALRFATA